MKKFTEIDLRDLLYQLDEVPADWVLDAVAPREIADPNDLHVGELYSIIEYAIVGMQFLESQKSTTD